MFYLYFAITDDFYGNKLNNKYLELITYCVNVKKTFLLIATIFLLSFFSIGQDLPTISLNGSWDVIFDNNNKSSSHKINHINNIFDSNKSFKLKVPSCLETFRKDYEGVALYRKSFFVPETWSGRNVEITFNAVNYTAEIWLNNKVIGTHKGGYTPFTFQLNKTIKVGDTNTIILRVVTPIILTDQRIDGIGRLEVPSWRGAINGGIWQDVYLSSYGNIKIDDIFIKPNYETHVVELDLKLNNIKTKICSSEYEILLFDSQNKLLKKLKFEKNLNPGLNLINNQFSIEEAFNWEPESPYLYTLKVELKQNEKTSHIWSHKFGFREFTMKNGKFFLNGKEFFLKGAFFEGLYPVGISYPANLEMARKEIQLAIDAGFNMIRPWRKPPPKMWLDLCDEMGVLTVGSIAIECMHRPIATPALPEMVEIEVRESILRDRNRTCVIQWELFNELWQPVLKQMMHPMALLARDIDPTRIILDESGGFANGANFYLPYQKEAVKFNDIHNYPGWRVFENWISAFLGVGLSENQKRAKGLPKKNPGDNVVPGLPVFLSEIGYGSIPDFKKTNAIFKEKGNSLTPSYRDHLELEHAYSDALVESGFNKQFKSVSELAKLQQDFHGRLNRRMIEGARINPFLIGYCVHALCGGDWVLGAGLIDIWRNPKGDVYTETAKANKEKILILRSNSRNLYSDENIEIETFVVNELADFSGNLELSLKTEKGKKVWNNAEEIKIRHGINNLEKIIIKSEGWVGKFFICGELKSKTGELIYDSKIPVNIFSKSIFNTNNKLYILESNNKLNSYLNNLKVPFSKYSAQTDGKGLIIVGKLNTNSDDFQAKLLKAKDFAKAGGNVVYLDYHGNLINDRKARELPQKQLSEDFPIGMAIINTNGLWQSTIHMIKDHPIFKGVTNNNHMDEVFENVGPTKSFFMPEGKIIAGVISTDRYPNQDNMQRHFIGVGDVWYASDFSEIKLGNGLLIPTTLKILNQLGIDPVADKLFYNIVNYYGK